MKRSTMTFALVAALAIAPLAAAQGNGYGQGYRGRRGGQGGGNGSACHQILLGHLATLPQYALSAGEEAALLHMREEEKLARDVYTTLANSWNHPSFVNISAAEQRHMDLMAILLERYGLADPVADDTVGSFSDPAMGALYADLTAAGASSLEAALKVGATIEDLDLADLGQLLQDADNPDIALVANNLAKGSRNHLRAFTGALASNGFGGYTAQYLSQTQVDEIVASSHERRMVYDENGDVLAECGGGRGQGRGRGQGQGANCTGNGPRGQGRGQGGGGLRDGSCRNIN